MLETVHSSADLGRHLGMFHVVFDKKGKFIAFRIAVFAELFVGQVVDDPEGSECPRFAALVGAQGCEPHASVVIRATKLGHCLMPGQRLHFPRPVFTPISPPCGDQ